MGLFGVLPEDQVDGTAPDDPNPLARLTAAEFKAVTVALNRVRMHIGADAVLLDDYITGADHAVALQDAIDDSVAQAQASGSNVATVLVQPKIYTFSRGLQQGGTRKANAQVALPLLVTGAAPKVTLRIVCPTPQPPLPMFGQTVRQDAGAIFQSTLTGAAYSSIYGIPSVIGSVTDKQAGSLEFNNLMVVFENIRVRCPDNPSLAGVDLSHVAETEINGLHTDSGFTAWVLGVGPNMSEPLNPWAYGLIMPTHDNNAWQLIRSYSSVGFYTGICVAEHTKVNYMHIGASKVGVAPAWGDAGGHPHAVDHAIIEKCPHVMASVDPTGGGVQGSGGTSHRARMNWFGCSLENPNPTSVPAWQVLRDHLSDPSNQWDGYFRWFLTAPGATPFEPTVITKVGAANLTAPCLIT